MTATAYAWDGTLATSGVGTLGGWVETTTYANARTAISKQDLYNRELFKQDLGGHQFTATFDAAGRQLTRGAQQFSWYNSGLVATSATVTGTLGTDDWDRKLTTYGYDALGNRTAESLVNDGSRSVYHPPQYPNSSYYGYYTVETYSNQFVNETASYDALGRLTAMNESGTPYYTPAASITEQYDAAGNIRRTTSTHVTLNQNGAASGTVTDDYWFRYDAMNRLVTDKGVLSGTPGAAGTTVVRGTAAYGTAQPGQDYVYDLTGQRVAALRSDYSPGSFSSYYSYYSPGYYQETRENYDYDGAGRVSAIRITQGAGVSETYDYSTGLTTPPSSIPSASASGGTNRSLFGYDLSGRQISQTDYDTNGTTVVYSRSAVFAMNGQLTSDYSSTLKYESNGYSTATYATSTSYSYTAVGTGEYLLGAVGSVDTSNYKNGSYQNASNTTNTYVWYDSAVQGTIAYKPNTSQSTVFNTYFGYDQQGTITSATINDGRPHSVTYRTNADGQIIRRDEADNNYNTTTGGDPHELWYRFAGKEFGYVGNNGTSKVTEDASIADRRAYQNTGAFRNGSSYAAATADFAQSATPINSYSQGSSAGGYTVQRNGETLRSVAQSVWGDASLWYKLADANGMKGDMALTEGQRLSLPAGISRTRNNAATLTPYNPNDAIGNVSPTTPKPAANGNKCGVFGQILLVIIAIAVTIWASPAALGSITLIQGVIAGVAGSVASQAVGLATGIQQKCDFKGLALAAIAGGISGGIGQAANAATTAGAGASSFGKFAQFLGKANFVSGAARGIVSSAMMQGIAVATGLQSKFDFVGVAAAGLAGGVSGALQGHFTHLSQANIDAHQANAFTFGERLVTNTASGLANAATRSIANGSDFGDNLIAALPDIIGNTIGSFVAERVTASSRLTEQAKALAAQVDPAILDDSDRFSSFRSDYKTALKLIQLRDGGDTSNATARRLSDTYGRLLDSPSDNGAGPAQQAVPADSSGVEVVADRLLTHLERQTDPTTRENYSKWATALQAQRDSYEAQNDGYTMDILPTERGTALEYLIKAPFLSAGSFVYDNVPIVGTAKSATQLYTGRDVVTGAPVNRWIEGGTLAFSVFPFGKTVGRAAFRIGEKTFGRAAERAAPEFVTVFRGDRAGTTIIKSNAAREGGYASSQRIIDSNNLDDLFQSHALDSSSPASPFISVTSDPNVARYFAGPNGVVNEFRIPVSRATPNPFNNYVVSAGPGGQLVSEAELLVPNYIRPSEFVRRP